MIFLGRVWKFGDDVDTDVIIPVRYCGGNDVREFGRHCMEGIDPHFSEKVTAGDMMVAGRNFGCGSSREPAPLAIKASGVSCVIARSFARIFYRNAFNVGLPLLECDQADSIAEGDEIEVNLDTGEISDLTMGKSFQAKPIPAFMQDLLRTGGLMQHVAKRLGLSGKYRVKVEIKLFGTLGDFALRATPSTLTKSLEAPTTAAEILEELDLLEDIPKIILVNGLHAGPDYVLQDGDVLSVFPPIAGG